MPVGHLSPFLDEPRSLRYHDSYFRMIHDAVERVRLMREAVGDDMDFCLELHRRMKPGEAIAFAQQVEKYTPFFLEDPTTPDNFDSMALIASRSNVPIATGERIHTIQEFEMLLSRNAMSYVRTSVCLCGGISGAKKIAAIAEAHNAMIVPHNPLSPVSTAACLQIAASTENFAIQELPDHTGIAATGALHQHQHHGPAFLQPERSRNLDSYGGKWLVLLPEGPGIGVDLQPDIETRFPFKRRTINTRLHEDGSIVDQ